MDNYPELLSSLPLDIKRRPYIIDKVRSRTFSMNKLFKNLNNYALIYKQYLDTVQKVLMILKTSMNNEIGIIVLKAGFKLRTLYNWKERLFKNREYNLLVKQKK